MKKALITLIIMGSISAHADDSIITVGRVIGGASQILVDRFVSGDKSVFQYDTSRLLDQARAECSDGVIDVIGVEIDPLPSKTRENGANDYSISLNAFCTK